MVEHRQSVLDGVVVILCDSSSANDGSDGGGPDSSLLSPSESAEDFGPYDEDGSSSRSGRCRDEEDKAVLVPAAEESATEPNAPGDATVATEVDGSLFDRHSAEPTEATKPRAEEPTNSEHDVALLASSTHSGNVPEKIQDEHPAVSPTPSENDRDESEPMEIDFADDTGVDGNHGTRGFAFAEDADATPDDTEVKNGASFGQDELRVFRLSAFLTHGRLAVQRNTTQKKAHVNSAAALSPAGRSPSPLIPRTLLPPRT